MVPAVGSSTSDNIECCALGTGSAAAIYSPNLCSTFPVNAVPYLDL